MKENKHISVFANLIFFSSLLLWSIGLQAQAVQSLTFAYTGLVQTFTVPNCVGTITVDARGGEGANANDKLLTNSSGGPGGRAVGIITVTPGQVLTIYVGGMGNQNGSGGFNGGGAGGNSTAGSSCLGGPAGGGGGASDVRVGGIGLSNRVIVGAGGGGAGRDYCNGSCQPCGCGGSGGAGGGLNGTIGQAAHNCGFSYPGGGVNGGAPGTQTAGGAGGPGDSGGNNGFTATLNIGGNGGDGQYDVAGGGGGGGYFGGGGGGGASNGSGVGGGGGGGGSSYVSGLTAGTTTTGYQLGNGSVIFNYEFISPLTSAIASPSVICTGGSSTLSASGMTSYTWSPGSSGASSMVVSPSVTSSYTVAGTSPLGCLQISALTVTVNNSPPTLSVSSSSAVICPTNTVTLTAIGAINYTWTGGVSNGIPFSPLSTSMYTVYAANGCGTVSATLGITVTPLPVVALASPSIICAGDAATLTAGAATNYTWLPGVLPGASVIVSPTASVVYTVTGATNVCAGITTVAINVNPIPTVAALTSNSTICAGSSVSLSASGAQAYTWQPGGQTGNAITVSPGVSTLYMVTGINSFSCTATANQVILVTPSPTLNLVASNTLICTGGSATLFVSGANNFSWSVPATGSILAVNPGSSSTYSVTGTNTTTGCSASTAISISVITRSIAVSPSTAICLGNTITLNATGATSYTWSNGSQSSFTPVSPTVSTVYLVNAITFTNNMYCASNASVSVTVNPIPAVTAASTRTSICRNETVTITATGASTYLWTNLLTAPSFTFKGTANISYNYTVTGTNSDGCSNTATLTVKVSACTGMEEVDALSGLQIFPNPSSAEFILNFGSLPKNMSIRIYNTLGHLVKTQEVISERTVIDLEKEASGVYLIDFIQNNRSVQVSKIIKQ